MAELMHVLKPPCAFGKYELLERIGTGGMAEVFRAKLPGIAGFEKIVVIKCLHAHLLDQPSAVAMFVEEAKLAAQVQHKNVVQVHELDRLPTGEYFMVLEYVQGTDLKQLLQHARNTLTRIAPWLSVHIAIEVLEALIHAHALTDPSGRPRNIVHRDVAPDNIFISDLGDIKLGDFGVAKDDARPDLGTHEIKGKISYMAPEALAGSPIDQRYDVFALGVVLWECLTQRPLFRGETTAETISMICSGERWPPSAFAQRIPPELDQCVLRALEHDRARRFPSTREMQARLLEILPRLRQKVGPIAVRTEMQSLLSEEVTVPTLSGPPQPNRPKRDSEPLEITDDLIVDETVDENARTVEDHVDPSTSWDGTYAIINPRLRPDLASRSRTSAVETDDLLSRHLVYSIPMPGEPSDVETADIIKSKHARMAEGGAADPIVFQPEELVDSPTPTSGSRVWEPYEGPHPFWMRSLHQLGFGPCSIQDLLTMIRVRVPVGARRSAEISGDGRSWMPLKRFIDLARLHGVEFSSQVPDGVASGQLETSTVVPLFGRLAQHRASGRLVVINESLTPAATIEIHMIAGAPTLVTTSNPRLDTPTQLTSQRVLDPSQLEACMHAVVLEERPLEEIVLERTGIDLSMSRTRFMLARLEPLLTWRSATFAFTPSAPAELDPFAPSLLALLPPLVHRTKSIEQLRALLGTAIDGTYERTERFDDTVRELALSAAQLAGINPLGQTRTLDEALRCSLGGEKFALTMAYILVNLGLLRPRVRSFSSTPPY
jgi:eukaryotic-like serine/threonine-protein kinase